MKYPRNYRSYDPHASFLLPPSMNDWLPKNHMIWFLMDLLSELDLSAFERPYGSSKGQPAYPPRLLLTLLLYGYCTGCTSSRKIEQKSHEDLAFRIAAGNQHPDHDTLCRFRKRHLKAFQSLFTQVLQTACALRLVSLGTVSLDGTKMKANASKHKAMSYERMQSKEHQLQETVKELLQEAERTDREEDQRYGKGSKLHTLPEELTYQQQRLETIRRARKALEEEARQEAYEKAQSTPQAASRSQDLSETPSTPEENDPSDRSDQEALHKEKENAEEEHQDPTQDANKNLFKATCQTPAPFPPPAPKKQRNFTDPDSRILRDNAHKTFIQGYNAQIVVEEKHQLIVAARMTQQANDKQQVKPLMEELQQQLQQTPRILLADAGYCSEDNLSYLASRGIEAYVATERRLHDESKADLADRSTVKKRGTSRNELPQVQAMRQKLQTTAGSDQYRRRKGMVEPVFAWIKVLKRIDQFRLRGFEAVQGEWSLIALTHNLDRLYRASKATFSSCSWKEHLQRG